VGDVNEGDLCLFPAGHPDSIQGRDPDGTEFLLAFNQGDFSENGSVRKKECPALQQAFMPGRMTVGFSNDSSNVQQFVLGSMAGK
jgi:hypothetical protein